MLQIVSKPLTNALGCFGPAFFMGLQLSSVQTALRIREKKSVGDLSPIPFLSLLTNSLIGTMYGILKNDPSLIIPNLTGAMAGAGCSAVYTKYSLRPTTRWNLVSVAVILLSAAVAWKRKANILGGIGCILCMLLLSSPLATLRTVIHDKSTEALPFWTSLTTWCNSLSWGLYGLLVIHDPIIYGPNFVGFFFACIQMSLFGIYGLPKRMTSTRADASFLKQF
mmetsp:Transcript_24518/g.40873  ORF Transcript_24518/g.40873 Transcript_24518/m.40873 type:complete len:223 (+) Transcript_24518:39-707(+)